MMKKVPIVTSVVLYDGKDGSDDFLKVIQKKFGFVKRVWIVKKHLGTLAKGKKK